MVDSLKRFVVVRVVAFFRSPRRVSATGVVVDVDVDVDDDVRLVAVPRKTNLQPFSPSPLCVLVASASALLFAAVA